MASTIPTGSQRRRLQLAASALAACAALGASGSAFAEFVPNEKQVSPHPGLIDYEFSQTRAKIAWTDPNGDMWLADVNRATGDFVPITGRGQLLAHNTVSNWNMFMWNGPEWISTATGEQIFYSYYLPGKPPVAANVRMAMAGMNDAGTWQIQQLSPDLPRMSHIASTDRGDKNPHIKYLDPNLNQYWRDVKNPASETLLTFLPASTKSWRFASGMRALVYALPINGTQQVFAYMLDSGARVQLTFDAGNKDTDRTVPWIWRAPEFNNDFVLSTVVNGSELRIYRQMQASGGAKVWTQIYSNSMPADTRAGSPEFFTYNGKSYVFMVGYVGGADYATGVWVANIDAAAPMFRKITTDEPFRARNDPEVFITDNGPLIYYNRYDPFGYGDGTDAHPLCGPCSEGVFRADPGLGAPIPTP